jgi:drug/metabolite transporter (DMT)-like permease
LQSGDVFASFVAGEGVAVVVSESRFWLAATVTGSMIGLGAGFCWGVFIAVMWL